MENREESLLQNQRTICESLRRRLRLGLRQCGTGLIFPELTQGLRPGLHSCAAAGLELHSENGFEFFATDSRE